MERNTPTPWNNKGIYVGCKERLIARCLEMKGKNIEQDVYESELAKANARFIVQAVNAHDALLEAAKAMVSELRIQQHGFQSFQIKLEKAIDIAENGGQQP